MSSYEDLNASGFGSSSDAGRDPEKVDSEGHGHQNDEGVSSHDGDREDNVRNSSKSPLMNP
jgi:hypothetical protein